VLVRRPLVAAVVVSAAVVTVLVVALGRRNVTAAAGSHCSRLHDCITCIEIHSESIDLYVYIM
jgi:hypothetical protein